MNNEFLRQYKRISKRHGGDRLKMIPELKEQFASLLKDFPLDMVIDLSDYYFHDHCSDHDIQRAADVIDLYNEELNGDLTLLTSEDLNYLKELVNTFAGDLDIDWIAYLMQFLLDKKIL